MTDTLTLDRNRLYGTDSHVHLLTALAGLDAATVGRTLEGFPYSIYQIVEHMAFWQEVARARIEGEQEAGWDGGGDGWAAAVQPVDESDWEHLLARFEAGVRLLEMHLATRADNAVAHRNLLMVEGHNSYHVGQVVLMRRLFGAWPPPEGDDGR